MTISTSIKLKKLSLVASFANELIKLRGVESGLKISISEFPVFELTTSPFREVRGLDWRDEVEKKEKFDFILGDFPLAWKGTEREREGYKLGAVILKVRKNWVEILKSLEHLNDNGTALYLVEPGCFRCGEGQRFEDALNSEGYFLNAVLNDPDGILKPYTAIKPVLALITKNKTNTVFIADLLHEPQALEVAQNFHSEIIGNDLSNGMAVEERGFYGFDNIKSVQKIEKLEIHYKSYEKFKLRELAKEINSVYNGGSFEEKENSIYIPKLGERPVVSMLSDTVMKHQNYFQVVLDESARNEYVMAFFRSDIGRHTLQSKNTEGVIPHLNKKGLEQATIAMPALNDQEQIIATQQKLSSLKDSIDKFDAELALDLNSSKSISPQLDNMLEAIGRLTKADKTRRLIMQGESKRAEFKETFGLDVETSKKEKHLEHSALKTIDGFLNTNGGVLLLGVADDGEVKGMEMEIDKFYKNNIDKFLLHVKNRIKHTIGEQFYPYVEYDLITVNNKSVLYVECKGSKSPCFMEDTGDFYVRTNPATDKLEGSTLVEYINNHFGTKS